MDISSQTIPPSFLDVVPDPAFLVGPSHEVLYRNLVARTAWDLSEETISTWSRLGLARHRVHWDFQSCRQDGLLTWSSSDGFRLGVLRAQSTEAVVPTSLRNSTAVPRTAVETPTAPAPAVRPASGTATIPRIAAPNVLVADDNRINRTVLAKFLSRWSLVHTMVEDGTTALQALERERFGLVLLDWQMPGLDGLEVARRWRVIEAAQHLPRTPLVAVTNFTFEIERLAFLKAGIDDILPKPVRSDRLAAMVQKWTRYTIPTELQSS